MTPFITGRGSPCRGLVLKNPYKLVTEAIISLLYRGYKSIYSDRFGAHLVSNVSHPIGGSRW